MPSQNGRVVGDDDDDDFPLREGSSPGGIARPEGRSALPKFHLEMAVLHPESFSLYFSRSRWLIYEKMGIGGGPRRAQTTMACLGYLERPGGLCLPSGPSL